MFCCSYSLEGLAAGIEDGKRWIPQSGGPSQDQRGVQRQESEERGSLMSLTEEGPESDLGECSSPGGQVRKESPNHDIWVKIHKAFEMVLEANNLNKKTINNS